MEELNHTVMHICTQSFITTASLLFNIFFPIQKMVQAAPSRASCNWQINLEESNFAFCALHSQLSFPISRALFIYQWWNQGIVGRRTHGRVAPTSKLHIKTHQSSNKHTDIWIKRGRNVKSESQQTTDAQTTMSMWKKTTTGEGSTQGLPRSRQGQSS